MNWTQFWKMLKLVCGVLSIGAACISFVLFIAWGSSHAAEAVFGKTIASTIAGVVGYIFGACVVFSGCFAYLAEERDHL